MSSNAKGYLAAVASAVCYGMNPLGIYLYREGINTTSALFYRFSIASVLLAITLLAKKESLGIGKKDFPVLISLGLAFAVSSLTYYHSFLHLDAGISSTILFIYPIMVAIIMATLFHEEMTLSMVVAIGLAMVGVCILYYGGETELNITGVVLVLISALAYAIYMVIVNRTKPQLSAYKLTFYASFFCAMFILIDSLFNTEDHLMWPHNSTVWLFAFVLGIFPGLLSLLLITIAVRHIGSTRTAIFGALEPVTALLIGVVLLNETLTVRMGVGIYLILISVILIIIASSPKNKCILRTRQKRDAEEKKGDERR